ncbi:M56 family metallopeptidase [Alienimonas chondri]|uniref:Peptidase M56 domain-containing protein n=1 Tax=Alienimonas chondri TaxID=2681879 RepID=A0ABX1VDG9_9PLAN|nr:M56 family metallopeptidase [Alienimonas chondri]NNJ26155.1 hypothetical protein [Alienimonas chondri]
MSELFPQTPADWLAAGALHAGLASLLAIGVWLLTRVWRNPHVGRVLWLAVLAKLICPPLWAVSFAATEPPMSPARQEGAALNVQPLPSPRAPSAESARPPQGLPFISETAASVPPTVVVPVEPPPNLPEGPLPDGRGSGAAGGSVGIDVASRLLWAWLIGTLSIWLLAAARSLRFARSARRLPAGDERLTTLLEQAATRMRVRTPRLRMSQHVGPLLWAVPFRRATVVAPAGLFAGSAESRLSDDRAEALFAHECAHLARRDHLVRWFELLVCGLWWWLPTVWLAAGAGRRCEELCCDAAVLATCETTPGVDSAAAYAEGLLAAAEYFSSVKLGVRIPVPLPASGVGRPPFLKRRFEMILSDNLPRRPRRGVRTLLAGLAGATLLVGVTFAGPPGEEAVEDVSLETSAAATPNAEPLSPAVGPTPAALVERFNADHAERANELNRKPVTVAEVTKAVADAYADRPPNAAVPESISPMIRVLATLHNRLQAGEPLPPGTKLRGGARDYGIGDGTMITGWDVTLQAPADDGSGQVVSMVVRSETAARRPATPAEIAAAQDAVDTADATAPPAIAPEPTALTLPDAVAAYNATDAGRRRSVTVQQVAEAVRRGLRKWPDESTGGAYGWVLGNGDPPAGSRLKIVAHYSQPSLDGPFTPFVEMSAPGAGTTFQFAIRDGGLSAETRAKISAALATAADDAELPLVTRLNLLRETTEPGTLPPERVAGLYAALPALAKDRREDAKSVVEALEALRATPPTAESARDLAELSHALDHVVASVRQPAGHLLFAKKDSATGLRILLDAAALPAGPIAESARISGGDSQLVDAEQQTRRQVEFAGEVHRGAVATLLWAVRSAKPATDEAAAVLLEAATSDDAAVRAAAVEALAGAAD